jgi:hypothetical protein
MEQLIKQSHEFLVSHIIKRWLGVRNVLKEPFKNE